MEVVCICQDMKWTYWDYMMQPNWFLDILKDKIRLDYEELEKVQKKAKKYAR